MSRIVVRNASALHLLHRKEVIQPHLPIRLPCYDFTPIIGPTLDGWLLTVTPPASGVTNFRPHLRRLAPYGYPTGFGCYQLSWCDGRCVQGPGPYSPQYADLRLLAIPTSCRLVSASASGVTNFRGVTGGVYKARDRIHRSMLTCDY